MSFKITWKTHFICYVFALLISLVMNDFVNLIFDNYFLQEFILYPTRRIIANFYIQITVLMVPITMIHELMHGAAYRIFGGKVKYGFKIIYAYTHEVSEVALNRSKFLVILLAPVVIISLLSLLLPAWIGGIIYFLNLLGSIGDLYMALILCRYRFDSKIIDRKYGFDVV